MAKLTIQTGQTIGQTCYIEDKVTIGRLQSNDLPIQENLSSRKHFEVERIGPSFQIRDLRSRNGTLVNEENLEDTRLLSNGDVIRVGDTRVVFTLQAPPIEVGDSFGQYTIKGAATPVEYGFQYLARQATLDRDVTVETLAWEYLEDGDIKDRFMASLKTASNFDHPNILGVIDVGVEQNLPFGIFKEFTGMSLRTAVQSANIEMADALRILIQIADALVHVHGKGLVHGRLCPSTVLLGAGFKVKLVGFGTDPRGRCSDPALPEAHWHAAFASPELGRGLEETSSSDIYSLGTLAFWMITGHLPYKGAKGLDVLRLHASTDSVVPAGTLADGLPSSVTQAIDRLLKKSPSERPASAAAAKKLLENALVASEGSQRNITKVHTERFEAAKIQERLSESSDSGEFAGPQKTTIVRRGRNARSSASSERARTRGSSSRARVDTGISDRLVTPRSLREPREDNSIGAWMVSLAFIGLLYAAAYLVTRILLKLMMAQPN